MTIAIDRKKRLENILVRVGVIVVSLMGIWCLLLVGEENRLSNQIVKLTDKMESVERTVEVVEYLGIPGNDVLENYDVLEERRRFEIYCEEFHREADVLREMVAGNERLLSYFVDLDRVITGLKQEAETVFAAAERREAGRLGGAPDEEIRRFETEAAAAMARMDRKSGAARGALEVMRTYLLDDQRAVVSSIRTTFYQISVLAAITLLSSLSGLFFWRRSMAERRRVMEAEERSRNILETAQEGVVVSDEAERIIWVNPEAERMFGLGDGKLIGRPLGSLMPERYAQRHHQAIQAFIRKGSSAQFGQRRRFEGLRGSGAEFPLEIAISGFRQEEGWLFTAFLRDRTEEAMAEEALLAREKELHDITSALGEGVYVTDEKGRLTFMNPTAECLLGWKEKELLGREIHDAIHYRRGDGEKLSTERCPVLEMIKHGSFYRTDDDIFWRKDKTMLSVASITTPIVENGKVTGSVTAFNDITSRKQADKALRKAKEEAEAASLAKSEFLANMSHEIRTPINGIVGMTDLMLDTGLSPLQHEYMGMVKTSADSLLTVINDILDFSKIEAGKLIIEPIPFDLRIAIEDMAGFMAVKAREKGIDLITRYAPDAPRRLIGDPARIRQVLSNLTSNAIKFTHKGHVLINVTCEEKPGAEARLRLEVKDTGIGIPEEKIGHIFEKFTQADASTTRRYGGTGLGLAICRQLAELMGGSIDATSRPGEGSAFCLTLSLPIDANAESEPLPSGDLKGVRVLIVDDNEINRRILREQLTSWGLRNDAAASGEEALAVLRRAQGEGDPYQIAILDYQMPEMNGELLGRTIKADTALKETVLVMLTSLGNRGDVKRLTVSVFAAYLVKPVRQSDLMDCLATAWESRGKGRAKLITRHTLAESRAVKRQPRVPKGKRIRVLLTEDNVINQKVALRILEKLGCSVDLAVNGKESLRRLERSSYDLIFMDCQMPEMDGYEATERIRAQENGEGRIPIIAMTANAMQGDREKCLAAGMDDYIAKPVKQQDLGLALEKWGNAEERIGN